MLSIFEGRDLAAVDPEVGSSDPGTLSAFVPAHYTGISDTREGFMKGKQGGVESL